MSNAIRLILQAVTPHKNVLIGIIVATSIVSFATQASIQTLIDNGNRTYVVLMLVVSSILGFASRCIKDLVLNKLCQNITCSYFMTQINRYQNIDADSRNKFESTEMFRSASELAGQLSGLLDESVFHVTRMLESSIVLAALFYYRGQVMLLAILIVVNYIWNKYVTIKVRVDAERTRISTKVATTKLQNKATRLLPELQQRRSGATSIVNLLIESSKLNYKLFLINTRLWASSDLIGQITICVTVCWLYMMDNGSRMLDLIVIYPMMREFNMNILMCVLTYISIRKVDTAYEKFEQKWSDTTPYTQMAQLPFPASLPFRSLAVSRDCFELNAKDVVITNGKTYLITGESGSGKSTICSLLIGDLSGAELVGGMHPGQFRDCYAMSYQTRKFQDSDITLREIFDIGINVDDAVIYDLLELVELGNWTRKLKVKPNTSAEPSYMANTPADTDKHSLLYQVTKEFCAINVVPILEDTTVSKSSLDIKINGLSGGEKTRIDLVRTVIRAMDKNISVVIFDEPDSGVSQEQGMRVLLKILNSKYLLGKTKIVVTHMCQCQLRLMNFDERWNISAGQLTIESKH